jgi:hypothetical protein
MGAARARATLAGLAAAALLATPGAARGGEGRPWYAPDHAKLQLAGNVGFLSPGIGWAPGRLEVDLFLGWVPEAVGGDDLFSVTGKLTFAPWSVERGRWRARPLTVGLQLGYTFGEQYFVFPRFVFTPTALRSGLALGADVRRRVGRRTVGLYAELVALDVGLVYWASNPRSIGPTDVFSLALGARLAF